MNRKRILKLHCIFIILFALSTCIGCDKKTNNTQLSFQDGQHESGQTVTPDIQEEPEQTVEPNNHENAEQTEAPGLPIEETILGNRTLWEHNTALYKLDAQMLDGITYSKMYPYKENLLFTYELYDEKRHESNTYLRLVSFETGEVINEIKLDPLPEINIQEINGNLVVHDSAYGRAWIFNDTLDLLEEYQFEGTSTYFDPMGENVYEFTSNEGIKIRNLKSGARRSILTDTVHMYAYGEMDEKVTITYTDINTRKKVAAYVDLTDASVTILDTPKALNTVYYGAGIWHGIVCDDEYYYLFGDEKNQNVFQTDIGNPIFLCPETSQLMVFNCDTDNILRGFIYDQDGTLISSCEMAGIVNFLFVPPVWYEEYQGYVFTMMNENDTAELFFWDVSEKVQGENLELIPMKSLLDAPAGTAVPAEYYAQAKALGEAYGVQILIADQCETDFEYRTAELHMEEKNIKVALEELELALSSYPKGFMEQLKYDSYTEIEIQLLGDMYEKDDGMLLGGFIEYNVGKFVMGLNITESEMTGKPTHQTFFHEVSHIIEQKLSFESEYVENGYSYDRWNTFNPEGFFYENESEDHINMYWEFPGYFVDSYASTDQNEDRARIIEYASAGDWLVFEGNQSLKDKLSYYSQCIRHGFDTTGWPEKTVWEDTPW